MSDNLDTTKHHFENDRFATSSGMRLVELRPGFAKPISRVGMGYRRAWSDEVGGNKPDEIEWTYCVGTRFWSARTKTGRLPRKPKGNA